MTTFARSTLIGWPKWERGPMSYAAGFHAPTFHLPGKGLGSPDRNPACGANTPGSLARYDRDTCLWKTSQLCLDGGLETFSEAWPRSGMMRSGTAFRLPTLVHLTDGIASGSSRIPTPRAYMGNVTTPAAIEKGVEKAQLEAFVKMRPTPRSCSAMSATFTADAIAKAPNRFPSLETAVALSPWPTPTARDWKSGKASDATHDRNSRPLSEVVGGSLNPTWVEWLMGFPLGWTDSKPSETPSSRKSQS